MTEKITLDGLNQDNVSVLKITATIVDTQEVEVVRWRRAYVNSLAGRTEIANEVSEPFLSQIMAVWGGTPTVLTEPYTEPLPQPKTIQEVNVERITAIEDAINAILTML
jgi:hypothetical protein